MSVTQATKSGRTCRRCNTSSQVVRLQWLDSYPEGSRWYDDHVCLWCGLYTEGGCGLCKESLQEYRRKYGHVVGRMPFGETLRKRRLETGVGLSRFAGMAGLPPSALAAIEHGRAQPLAAFRERFADILALSPEERRQLLDAPCDMPERTPFLS